jgi:hypothetical protein
MSVQSTTPNRSSNSKKIVSHLTVNVIPNTFHIIPVGDNAMFHWVFDAEEAPVLFRTRAYKQLPFQCPSHNTNMLGPADAGKEFYCDFCAVTYIHTYHSRFIPEGVAEVSQIFL